MNILFLFVFWSAFYTVINKIITPYIHGDPISLKETFKAFIYGEYHMWFLYTLISLYIFTPFLRCITKKENKSLVLIFIFISLAFYFTEPLINEAALIYDKFGFISVILNNFSLRYFSGFTAYYLAGWYIVHIGIDKKYYKYIYITGAVSILITIIYVQLTSDYTNAYSDKNLLIFLYAISVFCIIYSIKTDGYSDKLKSIIVKLSNLTFGVYIIHPLFIELIIKTLFPYKNMPVKIAPIYIISGYIVILAVSFLFSYLLSKIPVVKKAVRA